MYFLTRRITRPLLLVYPHRLKHQMTNLYETLGVTPKASKSEIEAAYTKLRVFFEKDPALHIFFDDLTLAYRTLHTESSRAEYDEYLADYQGLSNMYKERHGD